MSEKRTLSTWLRSREVYQDAAADDPARESGKWRHDLLSEFDDVPPSHFAKPEAQSNQSTPLEVHHLLMMIPVGLVLFAAGWLLGSQTVSMAQISRVSPWVWMGVSVICSMGFLAWRGVSFSWRR